MPKRERLNGVRVNGVGRTRTSKSVKVSLYPNLERRMAERKQVDLKLVEQLAMLGLNDGDIAKVLQVTARKFGLMKKKNSGLRITLQKARIVPSAKVAGQLYKNAMGYEVEEDKLFYSSKFNRVKRTRIKRQVQPNTIAQMFWLKNQQPEFWKDKKEIEQTGPGAAGPVQAVKFVIVQPGKGGNEKEKVIDADFKILPGAGSEGRKQSE